MKKRIFSIIAAVVLLVGVAFGAYGLKGQGLYDTATEMIGCKKPETINYIQDPATLTGVAYSQNPDALKSFMIDDLKLESERVESAIAARLVYAEKQALSQEYEAFKEYAMSLDPELDEEGVRELIKDRETSDPMRAQMLKQSVMEELGLDEAGYEALASDAEIVALMQEGLPFLMVEDRETFLSVAGAAGWTSNETMRAIALGVSELPEKLRAEGALKDLLVNVLGRDEAAVTRELDARAAFNQALADKSAEGLAGEELTEKVCEQLDIGQSRYQELAADPEGAGLLSDALSALGRDAAMFTTANLFNNAITYLFIGIVLIVLGGTWLFLLMMDRSGRGKGTKKPMSEKNRKIVDFLLNWALFIILFAILVVVCIIKPNFLDFNNILNILKQASTKGILALGCAGLIVLAGTDLSIGRVLGLSAAVTASIVQSADYASRMFPQITQPVSLFIPLFASIAVAVLFSLINGFGVSKLHLHAFIVSLGTQLIAQGATCIYIESQPSGTAQALSTFDRHFLDVAAGNIDLPGLRIPLVVIYFLAISVIMWFIWNKTRLGKNMFAVGGNEEAAAVSGVNVAKTIMLVYLIAGVLYGTSAFLEAARITSVGANTGLNYELDAISACVVGGVSFSGGVGTIQGVVLGAIILQAINYSLQFLGVNPYLQYIIRGLIIILAVSIDVRKYLVKK